MRKTIILFTVIFMCAKLTAQKAENMRISNEAFIFAPSGKTITVNTTKKVKTKILKIERVNQALIESIDFSKFFSAKPSEADLVLNAVVVHYFIPPAGFDFHTDLRIEYTILQGSDSLFTKEIESHSVATVKEAFAGSARAKLSIERAVRQNIEMLITELSKQKF